MESHLSEESLWASALAARLRILQANFADDEPATRQGFIVQEIETALKGCVPEKRKAFLEALTARFPGAPTLAPGGNGSVAPAPPAPALSETPADLLARLLEAAPSLSPAQRAEFAQQLYRAGLGSQAAPTPFELPAELQKRLALDPAQPPSAERAAKALAMLFDTVLALDQLVWTLWKQIAPKTNVRKEADFSKLSAEFLRGSAEVSAPQVAQTLERTRKLIAGLLGAMGRAGATFARERSRLFDATAIEADARSEKKWNESLEFACWRKYAQLCKEYGAEPAIEKGIQEAIAKAAENLIMGRPVN
jgi:hypothetical protein